MKPKKYIKHEGKRVLNPNFCHHCEGEAEYYMITDLLWEKASKGELLLCLSCVQSRVNRKLEFLDFTSAPINFGVFGFNCIEYLNKTEFNNEEQEHLNEIIENSQYFLNKLGVS